MDPSAIAMVIGNAIVLASLISARPAGTLRLTILATAALLVSWFTARSETPLAWWSPIVFFSPAVAVASLGFLTVRDLFAVVHNFQQRSSRSSLRSYRTLGIAIGLLIAIVYMIVVPSVSAVLELFRDRPANYTITELTIGESLRIRSAKFAIFAIFTYVGACWGSFLNVVAYSIPRSESITLRSSACPKCGVPIRRLDNLPIFSYLNLGGRCRDCGVAIPVRYLIVELVAAGIFASLFLVELVTGAANVPGFQHYAHTGILWIILYTKWPVVGIVLYHAALMCTLLTLALTDLDRRRLPGWFRWTSVIVFAGLPMIASQLQPFTLALPSSVPDAFWRVSTILVGAVTGAGLGIAIQRVSQLGKRSQALPLALTLIGVSLGWQATVTIAAIFVASLLAIRHFNVSGAQHRLLQPTAILLAAAMLHHPFWKLIAGIW
ncbi:Leader peptidase (Prepilin peptidase) [Rhodopirellula islandica]|uniref:Leader peptidase (Prepilin peptidase) n=1 Tax=Rhodopirellula islandica TaxID=595434 RepID=A0A0J1BHY0_RHOIS|nr:Leader peptidase (Prepilin peptidase) [Rhodopirellula islandica]